MAAPERATWHGDDSVDRVNIVLTESTLTVDWSTGSVGSASQWVPLVSLSVVTYKRGPRVRFIRKKKKGKKLLGRKRTGGPTRLGLRLMGRLGKRLAGRLG